MVRARVAGPSGEGTFRLLLDTVASSSTIRPSLLSRIGIEPTPDGERMEIATVSGVEFAPVVVASSFAALGLRRLSMRVLAIELPRRAPFDGILGLDFFRGHRLVLDFRDGVLEFD